MIYVITGKTGHGKTAYAIKWARQALKNGQTVYSNTKIYPEKMFTKKTFSKIFEGKSDVEGDIIKPEDRETKKILYWQNFSDWQYMKQGLVLCDEGIVYFNARKWENLPDTMQMKFVQHRKDELDLVITVQHYSFIDKTLRMICERFINCELKMGSASFKKSLIPRIANVTEIDLPTLNRCENLGIDPYNASEEETQKYHLETISKEWFWIKSKMFNWYDTSAKMTESRPEQLTHNERSCNICGHTKIAHA